MNRVSTQSRTGDAPRASTRSAASTLAKHPLPRSWRRPRANSGLAPLRRLLLALALPASACAGASRPADAAPRARGENEEAGINQLSGLMRDFGRALQAKDFDGASARLREAEAGLKSASEVTRGHPDFEDVAQRVARARPRLEEAIERDRIERRNAAIAAVTRKGNQLIQRANILLTELARRVPEAEDMSELGDLVAELGAVEREGSGFLDDVGYRQHAEVRDKLQALVVGRRRQAEWQIRTSAAVGKTVEQALDSLDAAKKAPDPGARLTALRGAADAFVQCASAIADAASLGGYEPASVLTTRLGTMPVVETRKRCMEGGAKVRAEADRLAFHQRARAVAARVDEAMRGLEAAPDAAGKLGAAEVAIEALAFCQGELDAAQKGPGYDPALSLDGTLGHGLGPNQLRRACVAQRGRLVASLPALRWRKGFETMKSGLATLQQRLDEAAAATEPRDRIQRWQTVLEGLGSCVEKARALGHQPGADARFTLVSAFGSLTAGGLEQECNRQRVVAEGKLAQAVEAQSVESFVQTCKGDEVAVARKEGVPTRVMPVDGGRLFLYGKGPGARRFGFDSSGKAVDFAVEWRNQATAVATEVDRAIRALGSGDDAAALLAATEAALPVLDSCVDTLTGSERHPGYDARLKLATTLGRLGAVDLRSACGRRRGELAARIPSIKWRVALEQARDRAVDAYMLVEEARGSGDVQKRIHAGGAALGGYRECIERSESLARAPDADRKATVKGPFGPVNVQGLARACKAELARAQAALDDARAAEKLEHFVETCKGDEVAVAQREGMPDRIERLGNGRVFVYDGKGRKSKPRRFAFDANGARVEETVLRTRR